MKKKTTYSKTFNVIYDVYKEDGIEMIYVEIPKIGSKKTQLGNSKPETFTQILASEILNSLECK